MSAPGVLIAAPASGTGKTTLTLALLRALRRRGLRLGSFKVGPDYIDPVFHVRASGRPCPNLDPWAMRLETLTGLADQVAAGADLVVGEGVMGLFDGAIGQTGSTAELASLFDMPVVLVVEASRMGASAAALIEGFINHRDDVEVAGIVFNRVASPRHVEVLRAACDDHFAQPVLGYLPPDPVLALPERHLGLVQADERADLEAFLERAADHVERHVDLDQLVKLARPYGLGFIGPAPRPLKPLGQRIALASDVAFAFAYGSVLDGWRRAGAEIVPFSPLADEPPDPTADAVYLPGGYPELHAGRLAEAELFLTGLKARADAGALLYGECGGFMTLGRTLTDKGGTTHRMAGLLPVATSFAKPRLHLGYRRLTLQADTPLGRAGTSFRGHEFHYAGGGESDAPPLFAAADARGRPLGTTGARAGRVIGSFMHLIDRSADPPVLLDPSRAPG
jgi:cobyrinic acid a,c-diamide synthase